MTEAFTELTGKVIPLDAINVDTDAILPKQFLKRIKRTGFGEFLFYDWRYENGKEKEGFVLNQELYRDAPILLTGKNFGCGSSREHAPWALADFGIRVIIAPSFADIFYNNCFKNGLLPIVLEEREVEVLFRKAEKTPGYRLNVDLVKQTVSDDSGFNSHFIVEPYRKELLLKGLDEIDSTLENKDSIDSFEKHHSIHYRLKS
ncbi:isopropylmalate isomerase [[Bacillus] enclensis]|uniref:3-isopropylmalate dehydratase small subunit n=1 Tax=[Bacillus] enclensis TaxID=1402860 RepID=A0A0V8HPV4_9BACI|nr:3-isopropylmalate dehydratase small subunit [[Bacillus] enclensis]KSU64590.1 isopropylmalate isomerase [[Bacillus] enclensis]SCB76742.1 3-isopropylmalate/(R)-2-methylmalate dehydratase small subunit [[Bacillus] enclensis]